MNGWADAATTIAIAQLGTGAALAIIAIVGRDVTARLISALSAGVAFLSSELVWQLAGWGQGLPVALPASLGIADFAEVTTGWPFAIAVVTAIAAGCGLALALTHAARQFAGYRAERRVAAAPHRTPEAAEARTRRLMGILQREHEKLRSVREMHRYMELATRNSQITVLFQDLDLRYQWVVNPRPFLLPEDIVGKSDEEILPEAVRALVVGHKTRALQTGTTQTFEIEMPRER